MATSPHWELLEELPVSGPRAEPFSWTGRGTRGVGLLVRFFALTGSWVGNFERGLSSFDEVCGHPGGRPVVVIAGGAAYLVDAESHRLFACMGAQIEQILLVPANDLVLLGNGLWFEALGATGAAWRSRRISWDGMRDVSEQGTMVRGEAFEPDSREETWYPFEVDGTTDAVSGGSYNGPPM